MNDRRLHLAYAICIGLTYITPLALSRYGLELIGDWTFWTWVLFGTITMGFARPSANEWWSWPNLHRPGTVYEDAAPPKFKLLEGVVRSVQPLWPGLDGGGPCVFAVATSDAVRRAEADRTDDSVAFVLEQLCGRTNALQYTLVVAADWRSWSRYEPASTSLRYLTPWFVRLFRPTETTEPPLWVCVREGEPVVIWAHALAGVASDAYPHYRGPTFQHCFTLVTEQAMPGRELRELDGAVGLGTLSQQRTQLLRLMIRDEYWMVRVSLVVAVVASVVEVFV
jgi:hypothetical protein